MTLPVMPGVTVVAGRNGVSVARTLLIPMIVSIGDCMSGEGTGTVERLFAWRSSGRLSLDR
jgi:hypothetical protein